MSSIYLRQGDCLLEMHERPYEAERVLQALLADHPELLSEDGARLRQMQQAEVLAVEVKQYVDERDEVQTLVPRVLGRTEAAQQAKHRRAASRWDHERILEALRERHPPELHTAASRSISSTSRGVHRSPICVCARSCANGSTTCPASRSTRPSWSCVRASRSPC